MRNLTGIFLLILLLSSMAPAVSAHEAILIKSNPANGDILAESPAEVMAWFEEELVSAESTLKVFSAQGAQVDNRDGGVNLNDPDHASMIVTLPPLADGSYTVQWHVTLLDGDSSDGAFAFAVGEDQQLIPAAESVTEPAAEPVVAVEEAGGSPSVGLLLAIVAVLLVLLLIGGLLLRRRQS